METQLYGLWGHSPASISTFSGSGDYLSKSLQVTVELALTLTFQRFYKWLAPQEPEVVLGLGGGGGLNAIQALDTKRAER